DVEIGFDGGKVGAVGIVDTVDAGVIAVDDDLGRIGGQAEQGAELIYKIDVDVGFVDDGDGLAIAPEGGGQVVLDGEIGGREDEVGAGVIKAAADGGQRGGNLRRVGVGVVHLPIHHVAVNLSVEGGTQQADGSGDIERLPARFDAVHGEALAGEPV